MYEMKVIYHYDFLLKNELVFVVSKQHFPFLILAS